MKKKKKIFLIGTLTLILTITFSFIIYKNKTDINNILESKNYSYLPVEAKEYLKEVYEKTGQIMLTEKNKEENKPYLNPEYVKYLESGEASEYGYIPEEFIVEHSYKTDAIKEKNKIANNAIIEKHGVDGEENAESLSYYNLRDDGYITNIYDQGNEGLCWAFSSATSLESHLAIKSNKKTMLTFSEKQVDYATTLNGAIDVGSNPYITKYTTILGNSLNEGGNMLRFVNSTAIGISPVECKGNCSNGADYNNDNNIIDNKYWKHDYNVNSPLSPYEVLNFDNTQYSIDESLLFNPLINEDEDEVNALVEILKSQIVNNGSLYVGVGAYTNLSIEYTPTDEEKALNSNGKNIIYYIPYGWNPENALNHAVSVIGWDDNYTHNICLNKTAFEITDTTKKADGSYTCSSSNATVHTIKGAWILQNSWGVDKDTYIYLPYNTMKSFYSSITDVSEMDFDNSYRADSWRNQFVKGNTKEKLNKIKIFISSYNQTINIYYDEDDYKEIIVNDGSKSSYATLLKTIKTTYPGLYTIDLSDENIIYDNSVEKIWFRFDTDDSDYYYYASLHTNNIEDEDKYIDINKISKTDEEILAKCNLEDNKCISSPQKISFDDNNVFVISGITRGLTSNDNLTFKVLTEEKEDVTTLFHIFRNFSVSNYVNALISYSDDDVALGTYIIEVYYNDVKYDELEWKLEKHNNIIDGIGTKDNPHIIKTSQDLNDIRNHTTTNNSVSNMIYGYYVLENDLDLTYDTQDKKGLFYNSGSGWDPIYKFAGNFEGNNHVISGIYINRPSSETNVGLFGTVFGFDNYIRNIILKNVDIKGNSDVGALIGGIYESRAIDIHDIAIVNGKVVSNSHVIGGIIGHMKITEDSEYHFYNLFNNATVGQSNANFTGGFIGWVERVDPYNQEYNLIISDSINLGNVYGGAGQTGGIVAEVSGSNDLTFKNIISVGTYKNGKTGVIGDIFGTLYNNTSLNMSNIKYLTRLYGTNLVLDGENNIENNTIVAFKKIISLDYINSFDHKDDWIYPEVDGIKRIPMLKTMVNHFDFTEKVDDFEIGLTTTMNINDMIKPDIDAAKNIKYTYDEEYLTISSSGVITPKKLGTTTIQIDSLYDGYSDEIQVTIKDTVSLIYNSNNNDNKTVTQQVCLDTSITLNKNTFEYKGHTFKNWNTKADGSGDTYTDEQLIEEGINEELQLYAQWTPIEYIIYLDGNGGISNTDTTIIDWKLKYPESGKIAPMTGGFKKENYLIDSWNTSADGTGTKFPTEHLVFDELQFDENYEITLYAQWKKVEWKIYFDSNGGNETNMKHQIYEFDETKALDLNTFTKTGYTFKNWNTKEDGSGDTYTDGQVIMLPKDKMVLYAQWEANEYMLTFNSNGGTGTMPTQTMQYNVSTKLNKNVYTKEGYTFTGWNTKSDGTGISYTDEQSIGIMGDLTLYAQWKINEYTVTFNANGGTSTMPPQTMQYNVSTKLNKNVYTKEGYTFNGWNTKADGTGNSYTDEQTISITEDLTLYAQWKINEYTVTFNGNGGTGTMPNQTMQYNVSTKLNKNVYTKEGYTFTGWNTKVDGTGESYTDEQSISIKEDLILYAMWREEGPGYEIKKYTLDETNKYIDLIDINTTVDDFKKNIELNTGFTVSVDYKTVNGKNLLYTGGKTKIYKDNELYIEYTNIIRGDVNGNATIDIIDYIRIMKDIMDTTKLSGEYIKAADVNQNEKIDIIDYIRIMKMIMEEN